MLMAVLDVVRRQPVARDKQLSPKAFCNIRNVSAPEIWFRTQNLMELLCWIISLIVNIADAPFVLQKDKRILNTNDYFDMTFGTDVTTNLQKKYFDEWVLAWNLNSKVLLFFAHSSILLGFSIITVLIGWILTYLMGKLEYISISEILALLGTSRVPQG